VEVSASKSFCRCGHEQVVHLKRQASTVCLASGLDPDPWNPDGDCRCMAFVREDDTTTCDCGHAYEAHRSVDGRRECNICGERRCGDYSAPIIWEIARLERRAGWDPRP
jgi:hypothetical protein